jgi:excisionase family DNA binding protein
MQKENPLQVNNEAGAPLDVRQAAEFLRVSVHTLHRYTSKRLIPFYRPCGKLIYFDRRDLDAFWQRNRVKTVEEIAADIPAIPGPRERRSIRAVARANPTATAK